MNKKPEDQTGHVAFLMHLKRRNLIDLLLCQVARPVGISGKGIFEMHILHHFGQLPFKQAVYRLLLCYHRQKKANKKKTVSKSGVENTQTEPGSALNVECFALSACERR